LFVVFGVLWQLVFSLFLFCVLSIFVSVLRFVPGGATARRVLLGCGGGFALVLDSALWCLFSPDLVFSAEVLVVVFKSAEICKILFESPMVFKSI
jgi:hypothetical protein